MAAPCSERTDASAPRAFLTARWHYLALLNYVVDPSLLTHRVPPGTEIDCFGDRTYVSVVGFRFFQTRVLGVAVPLHQDFDEINLRFYVRRRAADGWRRGVAFVRELVSKRAIATVARLAFCEPYAAVAMSHDVVDRGDGAARHVSAEYGWRDRRGRCTIVVCARTAIRCFPQPAAPRSLSSNTTGVTA